MVIEEKTPWFLVRPLLWLMGLRQGSPRPGFRSRLPPPAKVRRQVWTVAETQPLPTGAK